MEDEEEDELLKDPLELEMNPPDGDEIMDEEQKEQPERAFNLNVDLDDKDILLDKQEESLFELDDDPCDM